MRILQPRLLPLTIAVLALLLAVKSAALVRAVAGAGEAVRQSVLPAAQAAGHGAANPEVKASAKEKPAEAAKAAAAPPAAEAKPPQDPPVSDSERALLLELRQRREQLEAREAGLATREAVLAATERKLAGRVEELQALQKKLETLEASRVQREDAGWQGLVKLYETMKPRDAATIMNELEMKVLLQVLDRMKEAKAAPILSAMHPDRAREVTDGLARLRVRDPAAAPDRG
jgi:flagellar motility protein MotE (MotC chaperone)